MNRPTSSLARTVVARSTVVLLLLAFGAAAACGSEGKGDSVANGGAGSAGAAEAGRSGAGSPATGGTSGSAAAGGLAPIGGTPASAGEGGSDTPPHIPDAGPRVYPDATFTYDAGSVDAGLDRDGACATGSTTAVPVPLDVYVVLDRSGSMNLPMRMPVGGSTPGTGDCNVGDATFSRWCHALNSLDGFFRSGTSRGTGVALQFFPAGSCTGSDNPFIKSCCGAGACCGGSTEAMPAVPLAELPAARADLVSALNAQVPWADRTPIEAALRGMIDYTTRARRRDRQMIGLLITDGGPEGCQTNAGTLATLVKNHRARTGIGTYVVGTEGAAFSWIENVAKVGGAPAHTAYCAPGVSPCHFYNVGNGRPEVFISVLQQIRRSAIACRFEMPAGDGVLVDPDEVALSFTPRSGSAVRVERVTGASACRDGGFYYDDNAAPEHIELCASSCDAFRASDGGQVEILLGCQGS